MPHVVKYMGMLVENAIIIHFLTPNSSYPVAGFQQYPESVRVKDSLKTFERALDRICKLILI